MEAITTNCRVMSALCLIEKAAKIVLSDDRSPVHANKHIMACRTDSYRY